MFNIDRFDQGTCGIRLAHVQQQGGARGDPVDRLHSGRCRHAGEQGAAQRDRRPAQGQRRLQPLHKRLHDEPIAPGKGIRREAEIAGLEGADQIGGTFEPAGHGEIIARPRQLARIEPHLLDALGRSLGAILGFGDGLGAAIGRCGLIGWRPRGIVPRRTRGWRRLFGRRQVLRIAEAGRQDGFGAAPILAQRRDGDEQGRAPGKEGGSSGR